ncbi:hypothetical protein NE850_25935 [Paraburkholderia sp. USG1]|uniref:hypothetical protein n=1 Tax=Paraburkholderia sp. USG1 TaxID=2952268 RepID=UPI002864C2C6|nr:hypothetical protein [Paraburkholderia sp. USG1]MDR8399752.1 hypothetical protein [Paraburkholderia sp. USG1]
MTMLIYESVAATNFITVYKDSDDAKLFYYVPKFAEISKRNDGTLNFGAQLFKKNPNDPNDGFAVYNFGVTCVTPSADFQAVVSALETNYGPGVKLAVVSPDAANPTLVTLTDGIYRNIKCQSRGANLYTDLACSFTIDESLEPDMSHFFQSTNTGWAGEIDFAVRTKKTSFEWLIRANWHLIQEHFRTQASVKYWWISTNISYETQKLINDDTLHIEISGGTPEQKEKIYTFAEKIATRLFVPTLSENPLPAHPSGSIVCFSLNYSKIEENKSSEWSGRESDYEVKPLGIAAYVGNIPKKYFSGYDGKALDYDLDKPEELFRYVDPATGARRK